ncbi:MAG TPA: dihydrofolate reductase family protein [Candidatus Krumholzibacteria bacterium]|nr:dihydrofolate reductase family protein [Candidatus Krumholzibacteria bacterium]
MRTITAIEFLSLDGITQAPGGPDEDPSGGFRHGGWTFPYFEEFTGAVMQQQMSLDGVELLLGRVTYDIFAGYWPHHGEGWPGINEIKKYVVSHDPELPLPWRNSELITGDVVRRLQALKADPGPDLRVWGSSNLVHTLLEHDLVDELWLKIFPVVLGAGKRLFHPTAVPAAFRLTESKVSPKGVIVANYERAGDVQTGSF